MKKILLFVLLILSAAALYADNAGIPLEVLYKGFGVRNMSMGGAGIADVNDATAVFWNPAYLEDVAKHEISASFEQFYGSSHFDNIAYALPMSRYGGAGLAISYMSYGSYDVVNTDGTVQGSQSASDLFITMGYGRSLFYNIKGGINIKPIVRLLGNDSFYGVNADVSLARSFDKYVDAALSFRNILPLPIQYANDEEKLIPSARLGVAIKLMDETVKIAVDAEKDFNSLAPLIFTGIEYNLIAPLYLRVGYNNNPGDITGGFGITFNDFTFDYGIDINGLVTSNKVALSYKFGGYELSLKADPPIFSPLTSNNKCYIRIKSETKYDIYKWTVEIKDSDEKIIKTWEGSEKPFDNVVWDGMRDDGMPHAEGIYTAKITVTDENGTVLKSDEIKIKISNAVNYSPVLE